MVVESWVDLMAEIRQRDVVRCSGGKVTPKMAWDWAGNGLPHFDHSGAKKRWRHIVKAAAINGIQITGDEVLRLSAEHKQKLAENKL